MIRLVALLLALAAPVAAQDIPDLPDVNVIRDDPRLDMSWVPPLALQQAIAAAEDRDWFDTFPATSPISQQVARNYLLTPSRTLTRVAMELRLGIDLANAYSPDEIMSIYAQRAYTGRGCYGIPASVEHLLGTSMDAATLRDFITLASVLKAPSFYDRDPEWLPLRFAMVVQFGQSAGFWSETDAAALLAAGPSPILAGASCPIED